MIEIKWNSHHSSDDFIHNYETSFLDFSHLKKIVLKYSIVSVKAVKTVKTEVDFIYDRVKNFHVSFFVVVAFTLPETCGGKWFLLAQRNTKRGQKCE